jgi:hypothetical protein
VNRLTTLIAVAALSGCTAAASAPEAFPAATQLRAPSTEGFHAPRRASTFELAVSESGDTVKILNAKYKKVRTITAGLDSPAGLWYDPQGDLYVPNARSNEVQEYAPGASSPIFTYSNEQGITPENVTTDANGNVYVAYWSSIDIIEYPHRSDTPIAECYPNVASRSGVTGVAVDTNGDVFFASPGTSDDDGTLGGYAGGLSGCNEKDSPFYIRSPIDLRIDGSSRLVVANRSGTIVIVPPPYTKISQRRDFARPFNLALNAAQNLLYVVDVEAVHILNYPSLTDAGQVGPQGFRKSIGVAAYGL